MRGFFALLDSAHRPTETIHFVGYPPELLEGQDTRTPMPPADILILVETDRGRWMLYRYTAEGEFAGDTWHMDLDEAKDQANFEYGDAVQEWGELPEETGDPLKYVLSRLR